MTALSAVGLALGYGSPNATAGRWIMPDLPAQPVVRPKAAAPRQNSSHQARVSDREPWRELTKHRMAAALTAPKEWNGIAVPTSIAIKAVSLLDLAMQRVPCPTAPFIVPCADGRLQLEWHLKSTEFELYFETNGTLSAWAHNRETGYEVEETGPAARDLFLRWAPELSESTIQHSSQSVPEAISA